jgi:hypothetical protein
MCQPKLADPFQQPGQHFPGHQYISYISQLEHQPTGMSHQPPTGLLLAPL